jgi:hypothetical protein
MNKFVTSALALAAIGTANYADPTDNEWLELDREINSLTSATTDMGGGGYAVLVRSSFTHSSDDLATLGGDDISGFKMEDVRVSAWGEAGDYGWRISYNLESSIANLEDAFVYWLCGDYFTAMMGRYKPRTFRSAHIYEENLLFISRTILGEAFFFYDEGIGARGDFGEFGWSVDIMNGGNGQVSDHIWSLRGEYNLNGGVGGVEGAHGASDDLVGTVGLTYYNSDVISGDASLFGVDFAGTQGPLSVAGEMASFDDDLSMTASNVFRLPLGLTIDGDSTPWSFTVSYLFAPEFEGALRYQNTDNADDETAATLAVIWYHQGMNAKWNAEVSSISTDNTSFDDTTVFQVGVTVGGSN